MPRRLVLVALAALASSHCGDATERPAHSVRDSAGVAVVSNRGPAWRGGEGWSVGPEPVVVVDPETRDYQLGRVASAAFLADGGFVVANGGGNELLFFAGDGRFVRLAGGEGSGPGEFRNLARVWALPGDSLLAHDWIGGRVSLFDPAGRFVRSRDVRGPDGGFVVVRGPVRDRSLLASGFPDWSRPVAAGMSRDSAPVYRDSAGTLTALGRYPVREVFAIERDGRLLMTDPPFNRYPVTAVTGDGFIFAAAVEPRLEVRSMSGDLERLVDLPIATRAVTDADRARYREFRTRRDVGYGLSRQEVERTLRQMPFPDRMPALDAILVDPDRNVWVREYRAHADEATPWHVLDPAGVYLGPVAFPPGVDVLEIGTRSVLGVARDDLDVQRIVIYRLDRNEG